MTIQEESLQLHYDKKGKIEVVPTVAVEDSRDLSLAYTPGVAEPCLRIQENPELSFSLTRRWNLVAVVTDGSAVLGLGDIGPEAGMPVMEGKCVLFKAFGDVDAFPLCVKSQDVDEIVNTTISMVRQSWLPQQCSMLCAWSENRFRKFRWCSTVRGLLASLSLRCCLRQG